MIDDLEGLKDFQRRTVSHVCRRLLDDGARRFLVADEVGLGKTMVARGVVAETVRRLQADGVKRIDVVYICSNQEIARQNLDRLKLPGYEDAGLSSRLTLLPLEIAGLRENGVNFISFTPGTSFDQASSGGWTKERALLLRLLKPVWSLPRHRGVTEFFRCNAKPSSLQYALDCLPTPDQGITEAFAQRMRSSPLRDEIEELIEAGRRRDLRDEEHRRRLALIGKLRRELAECCVSELEPDLVIMDEFQRFAELLDGESPAADLAKSLFGFDNGDGEFARVLLLSATPYKAYSRAGEDGSAHAAELERLLRFLFDDAGRAKQVQDDFVSLRDELLAASPSDDKLLLVRARIESELGQVMTRTERLSSSAIRNGMLEEVRMPEFDLRSGDVRQWLDLARLHKLLRDHELLRSSAAVTEYWKSAPWIAQFMDGYQFKRAISEAMSSPTPSPELRAALAAVRDQLDWRQFDTYGDLEPSNARMRSLRADTVDRAYDLLWMPPSMPYHLPGPPYDRENVQHLTKRLVFSSWDVVPRAIAGYLSYEAERRVHAAEGHGARNTKRARRGRERHLIDFKMGRTDDGPLRPQSMANLGLVAPSCALAEVGDPLAAARELVTVGIPSIESVTDMVRRKIAGLLAQLPVGRPSPTPDLRWYWAAPLLLDAQRDDGRAFWQIPELAARWSQGPGDLDGTNESEGFAQHVQFAQAVHDGEIELGARPDDLEVVLGQVAVSGPANVAARAVRRVLPAIPAESALLAGAQIGWGLRAVFNSPESIAIVDSDLPYWRSVLRYGVNGNLQAVFDEWMHVVADDVRGGRESEAEQEAVLKKIVVAMLEAMNVGTTSVSVDRLDGEDGGTWRTHFAVRYGQAKLDTADQSLHPQAVRRAFNSPMRPFVLASTSVGQEGLDFHTYCHAIVHWNLPSNPIDLEQREGRVHRYKGHAVRRNVAERFAPEILHGVARDPWAEIFSAARTACEPDEDELTPYWLYQGESVIERYVPALPYSKDSERYARVLREVVLYRMVFGQPRQDDLIAFLRTAMGDEEAERLAGLIRIDLSPKPESRPLLT